jgi:uncharacterized protein (DUF362 family)
MKPFLDRRQFLKLLGISGLAAMLQGCGLGKLTGAATPTSLPAVFTATGTPPPTPTATPIYRSHVAIGQAVSYDVNELRRRLQAMFDGLGGLADVIQPGARIGIKPNLTGGTWWDSSLPVPAAELFEVHPALVQALGELLVDAGAGPLMIMEGLGDPAAFATWGYTDVAARLNARLVDLCFPAPYKDFGVFPVGKGWKVYDTFYMNALLREVDVFISVAKMKVHSTTGVTLALKNLFGIPPISGYKRSKDDTNRSAFHESTTYDRRVPGVIVDLNLARPVHFALIDGVRTAEAGAGPWDKGYGPVRPGLLVAGKDPVATDAVAAALMGFDPQAPSGSHPFEYADNHLDLASQAGLGTNHLGEIGVIGRPIAEVAFPFKPVR